MPPRKWTVNGQFSNVELHICLAVNFIRMTVATHHPLVSRHRATRWRCAEGRQWCAGDPHEGGRGRREEGGLRLHWWNRSWRGVISLRAPRRENGWIASRSPNTNVPLLLLFRVQWVGVHLLLVCLHQSSLPPPQHRGSKLLLHPQRLLVIYETNRWRSLRLFW